ncbi:DUF1501 domain-containing protein [Nannocystis sp.]|uniref:DUF1501 domain-containing protein n=1 Tax=Nannocystis sp. TaxID=1962667 RepID=UPI00242299A4|nr:DUF1501 domain-containing protein [Nannocystis sp.]MBK7829792.1 DUF1501 domain-containing protein [Nannocystis sp.]MBK9757683.1 DUF1501 domain-containing protein [Nannocystis sp.]
MPRLTRRSWLRSSFLALGAAGLLTTQGRLRAAPKTPPRRLVLVFNSGGWDCSYALDPKPGVAGVDAPAGKVATIGGLDVLTDPSRPAIAEFFNMSAGTCSIVRGLQVSSVAHPDASRRILTGVASDSAPDVAAIASAVHGADLAAPYLILGRTAYSGPYGSLGARTGSVNQIVTLLNPSLSLPPIGGPLLPHVPTDVEEALIREHVLARAERELTASGGNHRVDDFISSLHRGDLLREIGVVGEIELARSFSAQIDLAVEALARGLCHSVQIETGEWDTHTDNARQGPLHDDFFAGLTQLVTALAARPGSAQGSKLLDETTIVVVSELGRTPRFNGDKGKDHWPVTSALLIGSGVAGGRVVGATTDALAGVDIDFNTGAPDPKGKPLLYSSFAAGVLALVGVEPGDHITDAEPLHAISA